MSLGIRKPKRFHFADFHPILPKNSEEQKRLQNIMHEASSTESPDPDVNVHLFYDQPGSPASPRLPRKRSGRGSPTRSLGSPRRPSSPARDPLELAEVISTFSSRRFGGSFFILLLSLYAGTGAALAVRREHGNVHAASSEAETPSSSSTKNSVNPGLWQGGQ